MVCVEERTPPLAEGKKLVIVESPTKMKSIQGYLGDGYEVLSSVGHIRDLADKKDIPADKKQAYGKYSIDIDNGFDPYYVESERGRKTVAELKRALKAADELLLATDEDREGEAIAWHLLEALKPKVPVRRMVFHEITKDAIREAVDHTRELDLALVDAQETRRILDRLYGWDVSPVLWFKVQQGTSAGRVQSAATRMVVERERERMAFVSASYWDIETLAVKEAASFAARLARVDGAPLARGTDFDDRGELKKAVLVLDEAEARALAAAIEAAANGIRLESRVEARHPQPACAVHHLDPAAGGRAQALDEREARHERRPASLREGLHHLYAHRLDGAQHAGRAGGARAGGRAVRREGRAAEPPRLREQEQERAGGARGDPPVGRDVPHALGGVRRARPRRAATVRPHLEAHHGQPDVRREVRDDHGDPRGRRRRASASSSRHPAPSTRSADSSTRTKRVTTRSAATPTRPTTRRCPSLAVGDVLRLKDVEPKGHSTSPKPRFTEASLVKALEEKGIGRPSTFASIIDVILNRGYVTKRGQALIPSWLAFSVVRLLEEHFADLVDYDFTAALEDDLDAIARGEQKRVDWLKDFYFGSDEQVGLRNIVDNLGEIDARALNSTPIGDVATLRFGKYGPYLEVAEPRRTPRASRAASTSPRTSRPTS